MSMFDVTWLTWWCSLKVGRSPFFIRCINLLNVKRIECVCVLNRGNMCMSHFLLFRFKNGVVELFVLSWLCMDKLTHSLPAAAVCLDTPFRRWSPYGAVSVRWIGLMAARQDL